MDSFYLNNFCVYRWRCQRKARGVLFFAHASGIAAKTYKSFLARLSQDLSLTIYAYDMRGFGLSQSETLEDTPKDKWLWDILTQDHVSILEKVKTEYPKDFQELPLILMGHSLGAWITVLSSKHITQENHIIALDPPLYSFWKSLSWTVLRCLGLRRCHEIGRIVRKRRKTFPNKKIAFKALKRSKLMRNWPDEVISDYIDATFKSEEAGNIKLRHSPSFEALLFEAMPLSSYFGFSYIPRRVRQRIRPDFIVGEKSQTCPKNLFLSIKRLIKKSNLHILKDGEHMFPFENEEGTISIIKEVLKKRGVFDD